MEKQLNFSPMHNYSPIYIGVKICIKKCIFSIYLCPVQKNFYLGRHRLKSQEVMLRGAKAADGALRTWHFVTDEHGRINGQNPTFADGFTKPDTLSERSGKPDSKR